MNNSDIYKKIALFIGTSAVAVSFYSIIDGSADDNILTQNNYLNESNLSNPYELKINFINEFHENISLDHPIKISRIKKMKFKLGKPILKEFSI